MVDTVNRLKEQEVSGGDSLVNAFLTVGGRLMDRESLSYPLPAKERLTRWLAVSRVLR
jgi:hypothetical protein